MSEQVPDVSDRKKPTGAVAITLVIIANVVSLAITVGLISMLLSVPPRGGGDYLLGVLKVPDDTVLLFVIAFVLQFVLAIIGIWGLVLGIVAIVKKRGRGLGAAAVTIAVIVPLFSFSAFWIITASRLAVHG